MPKAGEGNAVPVASGGSSSAPPRTITIALSSPPWNDEHARKSSLSTAVSTRRCLEKVGMPTPGPWLRFCLFVCTTSRAESDLGFLKSPVGSLFQNNSNKSSCHFSGLQTGQDGIKGFPKYLIEKGNKPEKRTLKRLVTPYKHVAFFGAILTLLPSPEAHREKIADSSEFVTRRKGCLIGYETAATSMACVGSMCMR